jgi:hypothetical protein
MLNLGPIPAAQFNSTGNSDVADLFITAGRVTSSTSAIGAHVCMYVHMSFALYYVAVGDNLAALIRIDELD